MAEIYQAEHITKTFGHGKHEVRAVRDVSFSLEQGQVTTIVGESGSGKTVISQAVLGILTSEGPWLSDGEPGTIMNEYSFDPLTGLWNFRYFQLQAEREKALMQALPQQLAHATGGVLCRPSGRRRALGSGNRCVRRVTYRR
jgi:ABC-type oligopeptide transport system ATPase subunit